MSEKPPISATELHSAGAVVIHASPFESLPVSVEYGPPTQELVDRWVLPFYEACLRDPAEPEGPLRETLATIDEGLVRQLLTYVNWRPRVVAGFFAGLKENRLYVYEKYLDILNRDAAEPDVPAGDARRRR